MKKVITNILLSVLFFITLFFVMVSLTICNNNFVIKILDNKDYYRSQIKEINKEIGYDSKLSEVKFKKDVKDYVKSKYKDKEYSSKIIGSDKHSFIYNKYVKFNNLFKNINVKKYIWIVYISTLILVFITGSIFIKTQKIHNLNIIIIINFILSMILSCILYIYDVTDLYILNDIKMLAVKYYMGLNIILLSIVVYNKIKSRINP